MNASAAPQGVLSIIVPAFNAQTYLKACVDSLLGQTYRPLEIILVDDGSVDNTLTIARDSAAKDSRIQVLTQSNRGAAAARNRGMLAASGEYIAFVDADDWVDADMFLLLMRHAETKGFDAVSCDIIVHSAKGSATESNPMRGGPYSRQDIEREVFPHLVSSRHLTRDWPYRMCTKIYRRQHLLVHGIVFNEELTAAQDFTFAVEAMFRAESFYYVKGWAPYHYRWNLESRTSNGLSSAWRNYRAVDQELSHLVGADPRFTSQLAIAELHGDLSALTYLYKRQPLRGSLRTAATARRLLSSVDRTPAFDAIAWRSLSSTKWLMCVLLKHRWYRASHIALIVRAQGDRLASWRARPGRAS